jgi:NAD(P)-dependent dehydrogenase (short-subunit alcohol dehydrogenase family)
VCTQATRPAVFKMLQDDATYLIIGGSGGIGQSIAKRMVERGARHIVLLSRTGKTTSKLNRLISDSRIVSASIYIKRCDVADKAAVAALVTDLQNTLPPIRGLIHTVMVLRVSVPDMPREIDCPANNKKDVLFEQMTFEEYDVVLRSKVFGAWNFHNTLLNTPLDFFIMLSSVAGIVGNRGQAAYAGANTYLDALARFRRRKGLAASSLSLTAVEGVGYLAENAAKESQVMKNLSGSVMSESEVLALVEAAIVDKSSGVCGGITGLLFEGPSSLPYNLSDGMFSYLRDAALAKSADANASSSSTELSISQKLQQVLTAEEAQELVTIGLRDKLGAILMLLAQVLESQQTTMSITAAGLDSLNAIELQNLDRQGTASSSASAGTVG